MPANDHPEPPSSASGELDRAEEVFARALRFLSRCAEDPRAIRDEDPRDLVRELRALAEKPAVPAQPTETDVPSQGKEPLPLRRRRSA